ncbi:MAG TPA: response regulator [Chthoniobacter sp.]|nr:response regulator [Chthoniobacter sp.]
MNEGAPNHLHILLVENHEDSRRYLAMYLEGVGHHVTTAATVGEALTAAPEGEYDVLLSDIGLPDGDGWQLLRDAHFSHPIFAIAMSGFGMNSDRERSKQAGYRRHLLKPIDIEKLDVILAEAAEEAHAGG